LTGFGYDGSKWMINKWHGMWYLRPPLGSLYGLSMHNTFEDAVWHFKFKSRKRV
jgi:hypothetical protein